MKQAMIENFLVSEELIEKFWENQNRTILWNVVNKYKLKKAPNRLSPEDKKLCKRIICSLNKKYDISDRSMAKCFCENKRGDIAELAQRFKRVRTGAFGRNITLDYVETYIMCMPPKKQMGLREIVALKRCMGIVNLLNGANPEHGERIYSLEEIRWILEKSSVEEISSAIDIYDGESEESSVYNSMEQAFFNLEDSRLKMVCDNIEMFCDWIEKYKSLWEILDYLTYIPGEYALLIEKYFGKRKARPKEQIEI